MLKVTLVKSLIKAKPVNRKTAHALGLRKISQFNTFEDTPAIRGMIHNVKHLLTVEEIEDTTKVRRRRDPKASAANGKPKVKKTKAKAVKPVDTTKKKPKAKLDKKATAKQAQPKTKAAATSATKSKTESKPAAKKPATKSATTKKATSKE